MEKDLRNKEERIMDGHNSCPIKDLLARLGDKWSMLVIVTLARAKDNRLRFSEMMREVSGISQRMLTTTLRYLERDGIVMRRLYPEVPPRVEYTLTERGLGLLVHVKALVAWIESEWPDIEKARQEYDKKSSSRAHDNGLPDILYQGHRSLL